MKYIALALATFLGCHSAKTDPAVTLAARKAEISSLVMGEPEDYARLIAIAAGRGDWPTQLDAAGEMETRCAAQGLLRYGPVLPQLGIGRVTLRYASRMSLPDAVSELMTLLDDQAACADEHGRARTFAKAAESLLDWCPVPGLRNRLRDRGLEHPVQIIDYYLSQVVGPAATRIEDAVAKGDAAAFIDALRAIETTPQSDRSEAVRESLATLNWLRHLVLQNPKYKCCGPLQEAVRSGPLGEALLAHLRAEPDPHVRSAIWHVFSVQPKDGSRAQFTALLEVEPDGDVRYDARRSIEAMNAGGERAIDMRHDVEDAARGLTPPP